MTRLLFEARSAIASRDQLAATNAAIAELNKLSVLLPNPQPEIHRLTLFLLPDSAYVNTVHSRGGAQFDCVGAAGTDAASLQQAMTEEPAFQQVTAPQAISRVGNTGLEQFFLDIQLKVTP